MPFGVKPNTSAAQSVSVIPTYEGPRRPLDIDTNYPIQSIWRVSKYPTTGKEGEQWMLVRMTDTGLAVWQQLGLETKERPFSSLNVGKDKPEIHPDASGSIGIVADTNTGMNVKRLDNAVNLSCSLATATSPGTASFNISQFDVTKGHVSLSESSIITSINGAKPKHGNIDLSGDSLISFHRDGHKVQAVTSSRIVTTIATKDGQIETEDNRVQFTAQYPIRIETHENTVRTSISGPLSVEFGGIGREIVPKGAVLLGNGNAPLHTVKLEHKGDFLIGGRFGQPERVPVSGNNGYIMSENSEMPNGIEWIDPSRFETPGNLHPLSIVEADEVDSIEWHKGILDQQFKSYYLFVRGVVPEKTGADLHLVFSCDNGVSYYDTRYLTEAYVPGLPLATVKTCCLLTDGQYRGIGDGVNEIASYSGRFLIENMHDKSVFTHVSGTADYLSPFGHPMCVNVRSWYQGFDQGTNAIKIQMDNGKIKKGTFILCGVWG